MGSNLYNDFDNLKPISSKEDLEGLEKQQNEAWLHNMKHYKALAKESKSLEEERERQLADDSKAYDDFIKGQL